VYFVSTNIDVEDGLFNGATGILKLIEYNENNGSPKRAWLRFEHPLIGLQKRKMTESYQKKHNIDLSWVAIDPIKKNLSKTGRHHGLAIIRKQIPLVAANGMTINKAQGSSMKSVVVTVNTKSKFMTRERLYVACSRATSNEGLFIDGQFQPPLAPKQNDSVSLEMERLRDKSCALSLQFLQDFQPNHIKLYYHNIQSFLLHQKDLEADNCAVASDIIFVIEPHLLETDCFKVENFEIAFKKCCDKTRNSEGLLILQRCTSGN